MTGMEPRADHSPDHEKIPDDYVPVLGWRERCVGWFLPRGGAPWWRRLRWTRVGLMVLALGLGSYLAAVTAAFTYVRQVRNLGDVQYLDLLLPTRWENRRVARGNRQLAEAKRLVEQKKFVEGLLFARTGLAQAPANRDGRLLLFEMLMAARRPDAARQTLLDGLRYHAADPVYLKPVLTYLLHRQEDAHVVALARQHLPGAAVGAEQARWLALAAASASCFRGNYDQAEDFLRAVPGLAASRDGRLLAAKIEWERGYRELALLEFRALATALPHDAEVHRQFVVHLRQLDRMDEARRSSMAFQIAHPQLPGPRIALLSAYRESGDTARVQAEAAALLRDFADDEAALLALADFAAGVGDVALVRRLVQHAQDRGFARETYAMLMVETLIVARDYAGALDTVRTYRGEYPEWEKRHAGLFDSLQAAALLGLGEESAAGVYLEKFLGNPNLRADNLLAVANRFNDLGAAEQARKALIRAVEVDPLNQAALTRLVELDVIQNAGEDLARHVQRLVRMRRPSADVLRVAAHKLGSDLFLFSVACPPALAEVRAALAKPGATEARR